MDTTQHYPDLVYHPHPTQPQHIADPVPPPSYPQEMTWQVPQQSQPNQPPSGHPQMSSMMSHPQDHVEYAPPSAQHSFLSRHAQDFSQHQPSSPSIDPGPSSTHMSFDSPQIPGSIGPDRGLSRRRLRPPSRVQSTGELPEYATMPDAHDPAQNSQYPPPQDSRPQTPSGTGAPEFIHSSDSSLAYTSPSAFYARFSTRQPSIIYHQPQLIGGRIVTPSMSSSTNSSTSNPRSASPALSTASALTSVSSAASGPGALEVILPLQPLFDRKENKKRRLYNTDRRDICLFAREHPGVKQEDIAHVFGVERSTVSKILKHKHRWLSVSINEEIQIAKMRPSKFPELEYRLAEWVKTVSKNGTVLTDALLRQRAREIGDSQGYTPDKFKASSGWLENFKHRHGIRRGVWTGSGLAESKARAYADDFRPPVQEDCPPGPFGRTGTPSEDGPSQTDYSMGADDGDDQTRLTHRNIQVMHPSASLNWSRADEPAHGNDASSSSLMYSSGDQLSFPMQREPSEEAEQPVVEPVMPPAEPIAIPVSAENGEDGQQVFVYPTMPVLLDSAGVPDDDEAEKALDRVLQYVRANRGELEMSDPGFQLLTDLKYKLFGKAVGQTYDSRHAPKHVSP